VARVLGFSYGVLRASSKPTGNHVPFVYVGHAGSGLLDEGLVCLWHGEDIFSRSCMSSGRVKCSLVCGCLGW
jgi:hypothetical protein